MKKLIKMYNEKYGDTLGVIDDDFNKEQMYRIYYFIKNNCDDKDIQDRIKMINLDKPKTLEQQLTKLESEHNKAIPSNNDFKEFTFDEELSTDTVKYVNLNTLIPKTRYKVSDNDRTIRRLSIYYRIPNSTDKINLINVVSTVQQYEFYCNTLGKTSANIFVKSYIYSSVSYRITLGNTLDACSVEKVPHLLSTRNSFEFTPTEEYHPTSKKYVDEKFLTDEIETVMTIPKAELDKCNDGFNGVVSTQSFSKFDVSNYIYYAHYGDKVIKMTYNDEINELSIDKLDVHEGISISLAFQLNNNKILPYNVGLAEVRSYVFTNDIIITGNKLLKKYVDDNKIAYTVSSKVLGTVPASNIKLDDEIVVNNITLNKDRKYYIEFLGSKKLCNVIINEHSASEISCTIGNYVIQGILFSPDLMLGVHKKSADDTTTDTFTDLILYEEEIKCLDNKYLETDLIIQNSISLGRLGDIGIVSSAVGMDVEATGDGSHAEGYGTIALGNFSHAEGNGTIASAEDAHAEGINTIASSMYQHVQGKNNIEDNLGKYAHIVGNGEDLNNRSNAHTLDWQGNAWYSGKVTAGAAPVEDMDLTTKKYVDDNRDYYFKVPTILYDDPKLPKGYVDIATLEKGTNYRVNSSIVSGLFKVSLKALNDDGTWFTVDDGSNTIGWSSMLSTSICVELKSDTFIGINMSCVNNYCKYLSITKENGKWKLMQTKLNSISPDNMYEYEVSNDYNPAHKKYVDDKVSGLPQLSFNESGELVVTINGVSKIFVPKSE